MRICIKNSPGDLKNKFHSFNSLIVTDSNGEPIEGLIAASVDINPDGNFVTLQVIADCCDIDINVEVNELNKRKIEEISPGLTEEVKNDGLDDLRIYKSEFNY